jgi:hypothetical protein
MARRSPHNVLYQNKIIGMIEPCLYRGSKDSDYIGRVSHADQRTFVGPYKKVRDWLLEIHKESQETPYVEHTPQSGPECFLSLPEVASFFKINPLQEMTKKTTVYARESILVDAQSLLQSLLNKAYGNPRDIEEDDPEGAKRMWKHQRRNLAKLLKCKPKRVKQMFSHTSDLTLKDLAEVVFVLGYELTLDVKSGDDKE